MKKGIAIILTIAMMCGLLVGCGQKTAPFFSATTAIFGKLEWGMTKNEVRATLGVSKSDWEQAQQGASPDRTVYLVEKYGFEDTKGDITLLFASDGEAEPVRGTLLGVSVDIKGQTKYDELEKRLHDFYGSPNQVSETPKEKAWIIPFSAFNQFEKSQRKYEAFVSFYEAIQSKKTEPTEKEPIGITEFPSVKISFDPEGNNSEGTTTVYFKGGIMAAVRHFQNIQ